MSDARLGGPTIASMHTKHLTHHLLNHRLEWPVLGQIKAIERQLGSMTTSIQWTSIVALWSWYLAFRQRLFPELVRDESLSLAYGCQMSIIPAKSAIALQF